VSKLDEEIIEYLTKLGILDEYNSIEM